MHEPAPGGEPCRRRSRRHCAGSSRRRSPARAARCSRRRGPSSRRRPGEAIQALRHALHRREGTLRARQRRAAGVGTHNRQIRALGRRRATLGARLVEKTRPRGRASTAKRRGSPAKVPNGDVGHGAPRPLPSSSPRTAGTSRQGTARTSSAQSLPRTCPARTERNSTCAASRHGPGGARRARVRCVPAEIRVGRAGGHKVQVSAPNVSTKVPGGQGEHSPVPVSAANVPAAHGSHWLKSVALRCARNVPAGHGSHARRGRRRRSRRAQKHAVQFPAAASARSRGTRLAPCGVERPATGVERTSGLTTSTTSRPWSRRTSPGRRGDTRPRPRPRRPTPCPRRPRGCPGRRQRRQLPGVRFHGVTPVLELGVVTWARAGTEYTSYSDSSSSSSASNPVGVAVDRKSPVRAARRCERGEERGTSAARSAAARAGGVGARGAAREARLRLEGMPSVLAEAAGPCTGPLASWAAPPTR